MASYVFFDEEACDQRIEVTSADIEVCQDLEQLKVWWESLSVKVDDMRAQIEARVLTNTADLEWVHAVSRALAFTNMGLGRIRRRMARFDYDPNPRGSDLNRLNEKLATMKASNAFGLAFQEAAKRLLNDSTFEMIGDAAAATFARSAGKRAA